ncbi:MAG TPA: methionine--tRNA ligase [bacterium]|nr:methionine--tRNA ligase [bacterium]
MESELRPIYITTPIYYVNDRPHVGHAYTTIVADYLARAYRLLGREAYFLTGTDEHGAKVAEAARAAGMTPREWCDKHAALFREAWRRLDIRYDSFIRTTDARHERGVGKMLEKLRTVSKDGRPVVYEGEYAGLYCLGCEKFITEKELVDGLCPIHLTKPQELKERNYFFRLTAYLDDVRRLIESDQVRILPAERKNEVLGLLKQDVLEDFSISREKVDWGIPIPWDPAQNAYVWVDALPNYITAIGYGDNEKEFAHWWKGAHVLHLMAKDILKFHAVYWPAMLLAIGEKPPETLFIHGYFTVNGQKMSKTLRNTLDPHAMVDQFGPDGARYLLLTQFQFGQDGDLKADLFTQQFNADLANDLGNLVSRTVAMIEKHFGGKAPGIGREDQADAFLETQIDAAITEFLDCLLDDPADGSIEVDPNRGIAAAKRIVHEANRYFDVTKPWALAKAGDTERLKTVLTRSAEAIRRAAIMLNPIIPGKSLQILRALGFTDPDRELTMSGLRSEKFNTPARTLCPGPFHLDAPIFPRLEKVDAKTEKKPVTDNATVAENVITIDQFRQTQLRTAEIIAAEKVEGADKLLKLQLALGDQRRQIVAGIALHYKPEDLVGRTIIIVANLQPTKIRGIESQGMLLAASDGGTLRLLTTDGPIASGSSIG